LAFKSFYTERTWWRLFQKRVMCTKLDIYGSFYYFSRNLSRRQTFPLSNKIDMNYIQDKFSLSEHLFSLSVVLSIMIPIWYNISFISNLILILFNSTGSNYTLKLRLLPCPTSANQYHNWNTQIILTFSVMLTNILNYSNIFYILLCCRWKASETKMSCNTEN
jgi:hypothetical protein